MKSFDEFINEGKVPDRIPWGFLVKVKGYPDRGIIRNSPVYTYGSEYVIEFPNEIRNSNSKADNTYFYGRKVSKRIFINGIKNFYWNKTNTFPLEIDPIFQEKLDKNQISRMEFSKDMRNIIVNFLNTFYLTYYGTLQYIDITDKNDMISYLPLNRRNRVSNPWSNKYRQEIKVSQLFKEMYWDISPKYLEKLVNMYKSTYDMLFNSNGLSFELVEGEDIRYWYNEKNYAPGGSTLNNSCMKLSKFGYKFNVYVDNPDKIKMLILKNKDNKLLGRALIWYLDYPEGVIYMDRPYTSNDYLMNSFFNYSYEMGWLNYRSNLAESYIVIDKDYGGECKYPFMDTFNHIYKNANGKVLLSNTYSINKKGFNKSLFTLQCHRH